MEMPEAYLQRLLEQIRCRQARPMIENEIRNHIEEQIRSCQTEGMDRETAEREAVRQMGDPVETGIALDRIHRPRMNWRLAASILLLSALGMLLLSILQISVPQPAQQPAFPAVWQGAEETGFAGVVFSGARLPLMELLAGILLTALVCFADYSLIGRRPLLIWCGYFLAAAVLRLYWFRQINGRFPAMLTAAVLALPLFAGILHRFRGGGYVGLAEGLGTGAAGMLLCALGGGNNTIPLVCWSCMLCMASYAIYKGWYRVNRGIAAAGIWGAGFLFPLAAGLLLVYKSQGFHWKRLLSIWNPEAYGDTIGYLTVLARKTIRASGLTGRKGQGSETMAGLGLSEDWLLTQTIYCLGFAAGTAVLLLLAVFLWYILRLAFRQKNQLGAVVGLGCSLFYVFQTVLWAVANLGGARLVSGLYIPFLSASGSALLIQAVFLGLLLSVCRRSAVLPADGPAVNTGCVGTGGNTAQGS